MTNETVGVSMNPGFIKHKKDDVVYFTFEHFDKTNLVNHCFTTKIGGVSTGNYESLNLGYNSGDNLHHVIENHKIISEILGIDHNKFVFTKQVHGTGIFNIKEKFNCEKDHDQIIGIDGLTTKIAKFPLHTVYADCVPIFILDIENKAIGIAHSGWRGTVGKIGEVLLKNMATEFGTKASMCLAGVGPSIGPCCFEVGKEVTKSFENAFKDSATYLEKALESKDYLNLWSANKQVLVEAGILMENIICAEICTSCNSKLFYSYRRDNGITGRMAGIMELK